MFEGVTHAEHQCDPLGQEATSHERQCLRGDAIKPLSIVDNTDQRLFLGSLGYQAEDGQADEKSVRGIPSAQAEGFGERIALWRRNAIEEVEHRCAELMQSGERQLHFPLDTGNAGDAASRRLLQDVFEQRGLADPGLSPDDQDAALTRPNAGHQSIECLALAASTTEPLARIATRHARG